MLGFGISYLVVNVLTTPLKRSLEAFTKLPRGGAWVAGASIFGCAFRCPIIGLIALLSLACSSVSEAIEGQR